jgi:hypothetical protein
MQGGSMKYAKDIKDKFYFYKEKKTDKMWWVDFPDMDCLQFLLIKKRFYSFSEIVLKIFLQKNLKFSKKKNRTGQNFFT